MLSPRFAMNMEPKPVIALDRFQRPVNSLVGFAESAYG